MSSAVALILVLLFGLGSPARADDPVDLALVLAVDSSGSVNDHRYQTQRRGYIEALTSDAVLAAIKTGLHRRIAIAYYEWSDGKRFSHLLPWTVVHDVDTAAAAAKKISATRRQVVGDTCIACAINEALNLFDSLPYPADRMVLDVSGDGESNVGENVLDARARAIARGVTINGLPIITAYEPNLDVYYEEFVSGGPNSFVIVAKGFEDFARAIAAKMVREISALPSSERSTVLP
jgi:hypothetical protein